MDAIATQERTGMLSRSMAEGGIWVSAAPSKDRRAIDNQIAVANEPMTDGSQDSENEESLWQRGPCPLSSLALLGGARMRGHPSLPSGKPHASASAGQARNQSRIS